MQYTNGAVPETEHHDYSTPIYDEVNGCMETPDTVPWCPEEDVASIVPMVGAGMDPLIPKSHRLPAVAYRHTTFFDANGTNRNTTLDHPANAVMVSNWTSQWARVQGEWVPPFTIGWVFAIASSDKQAGVAWEAPPGFTQPPAVTGALLRTQWFEEPLRPKPGFAASTSMTLNTGQASITATAAQIIAANGSRVGGLVITNTAGSGGGTLYVGPTSGVTTANGEAVLPGNSITFVKYQGAVWGIESGGTLTATYAEEAL